MATVLPLRGVLYNPKKIKDLALVTTPPFDVISEKAQKVYYENHPCNIVRLILGIRHETDTPEDNWHTRAAAYCRQWMDEEVLVKDPLDALYLTAVDFQVQERRITRYGIICRVGLEPFENKVILPHEKTFSKVKSDRLDLMRACRTNFSPIFSLYPDQGNTVLQKLQASVEGKPADSQFSDASGMHHRLWRIVDTELHRFVQEAMQDKPLFIADGHHRYETALNYREWLSKQAPNFNGHHPANYVLMYLSSMEGPGLVILPAHRMLKAVGDQALNDFLKTAETYFEIETIADEGGPTGRALDRFRKALEADRSKVTIGVFIKDRPALYVLKLKANVMDRLFAEELPPVIRHLDVTILTRLIFMEILGFDSARLDNEKLIGYATQAAEAIEGVRSGEFDITFILNPTQISQVREVAREGLIMPRKATYFYPKVIVGQVINTLIPD